MPSGTSQRATSGQPSNSYSSNSYSSNARASAADTIHAVFPDLGDDETTTIVETIKREQQPRDLAAYVAALAANGDLARYVPCDTDTPRPPDGPPKSEACRRGDGPNCVVEWCECRCHRSNGAAAGSVNPP